MSEKLVGRLCFVKMVASQGLIVGVEVGLKFGKKQQQGNQKTVSFVKGK